MTNAPETIVIGAGIAGLCCARTLAAAGQRVVVLESAGEVGGRVRTDVVETERGRYLLDRGFQVYLDAYPEGRRVLDLDALGLGAFEPGAHVYINNTRRTVMDPRRRPVQALRALVSPIAGVRDTLAVVRLVARLTAGDERSSWTIANVPTHQYLRESGISERLIDRFFRPFFGGVFFDRTLSVSARMFAFCFRNFARGSATLPREGMGAIPKQLASALPAGSVRMGVAVANIDPAHRRVHLADGETLSADGVVLACAGRLARSVLGDDAHNRAEDRGEETAPWRRTITVWFDAPASPTRGPLLALDGDGAGPINHLATVSDAQPSYAPAGRTLIAANVVGDRPIHDGELIAAARSQLERWFGAEVREWVVLRVHRIRRALPPAGPEVLAEPCRPVRTAHAGVYVCGDHLDNPSINGAMESGRRAGEAVLTDADA